MQIVYIWCDESAIDDAYDSLDNNVILEIGSTCTITAMIELAVA